MSAVSSATRISSVQPLWAVEGGQVVISGEGFPVDPPVQVRIGGEPARPTVVLSQAITGGRCRPGSKGGPIPVCVDDVPGETAYIDVATPLATGLHRVDSPVFDGDGNLYVTFSGSRGQQAPISIFVVRPDGTREPFAAEVPNPDLYGVRSRTAASMRRPDSTAACSRVAPDGSTSVHAADLGVPCGIALLLSIARCMSAIDLGRSCAWTAAAPRCSRACRPAWPPFIGVRS